MNELDGGVDRSGRSVHDNVICRSDTFGRVWMRNSAILDAQGLCVMIPSHNNTSVLSIVVTIKSTQSVELLPH